MGREGAGTLKKGVLAAVVLALCVPRPAAAFDDFNVGARPAAFSGAFTALADDVHSLHYNPAGLAVLPRPEVTAYYVKLLPGLSDSSNSALTYMAYGQPVRKGSTWGGAGVAWTEYRLEDLYKERTIILGYGRPLPWGFSAGANAKLLSRIYGDDANTRNAFLGGNPSNRLNVSDPVFNGGKSAQAVSFDLGALARPLPSLSLGAGLMNLNTPDVGLSTADRVPMTVRLGAAYDFPFMKAHADMTRRRSSGGSPDNRFMFGAERTWLFSRYGGVTARGGAGFGSRSWRQVSMGLGYEVNGIGVDYVYVVPLGVLSESGGTHQVSLSFRFGKSPGDEELASLVKAEKEATARAEEALKLAQAEAGFIKEDRNQVLMEVERLKAQVAQLQSGPSGVVVETPAAGKLGAAVQRERSAREKALMEFNAAYQAAMAAYAKRTQRGATLVERIALLEEVLAKYQDKGIDVSRAKTELERVKSDLAQAESDYKITLDFYKKTVAEGADARERISLLERMSRKYGRAGIDISAVKKELDELKKAR